MLAKTVESVFLNKLWGIVLICYDLEESSHDNNNNNLNLLTY